MKRLVKIAGAAGMLAALALAPTPAAIAADARIRGLEKVVDGRFGADDEAQIGKAFRAALQAGMAERRALSLVETCVEGGFEAPELARVLTLAAQLELQHLPAESFVAKIEEGVSKRVPAERVLQAAERRALMLNRAQALLNAVVLEGFDLDDREELVPDIAEALEAGRPADEIRRVLAEAAGAGDGIGEIRRKLFP